MIKGQSYTFRGTLALVSGDNLASHYLGGYKSLSSALRKCRHCMAVAEDMATEVIQWLTPLILSVKLCIVCRTL